MSVMSVPAQTVVGVAGRTAERSGDPTPGPPSTGAPSAPSGRPAGRGHLWQIDVVRLLAFSAVIAVHSLAFTEQPGNQPAAAAMMLLQFGREVFFSLTGFVLIYSTAGRALKLGSFWRKRILYVAVPYVAWSVIYYAYSVLGPAHASPSLAAFGTDLLYAGAEYHLYFLLVTIQLYLAFPLIRRFVLRTADRAVPVLLAVGVANIGWFAALQYLPYPRSGAGLWFFQHAYELLPTYSIYVLAGCYAAAHLESVQRVFDTRSRQMLMVAFGATVAALGVYAAQLPFMAPRAADDVLQPGMVLSCVAATIAVYGVGSRWARGPRRHQALIETLSDASFGVYLSHPFVLQLLLDYGGLGNDHQVLPSAVATLLAFVISVLGGTAVSLAFRRTPLSLLLTGRPWRTQVKRQPLVPAAVATINLQPAVPGGEGRAVC